MQFKNFNLVSGIPVRKPQPKSTEQDDRSRLLQSLVQAETRRMIECAMKFMRSAKRQELCFQDIESALRYLALSDIPLTFSGGCQPAKLEGDPIFRSSHHFLTEELECLSMVRRPTVEARWININGRVPRTSSNIHISSLNEQPQKPTDKFSVINDQPLKLLANEEADLLSRITSELRLQQVPEVPRASLSHIFPVLVSYLLSSELGDCAMLFLLRLLENHSVRLMVEHYFHQVMAVLLHYQGSHVWLVGRQLADLIRIWGDKYKNIYRQLDSIPEHTYPQRIKKLAVQLYFGKLCRPATENLERDVTEGIPFAREYQLRLNECARVLSPITEYEPLLTEGLTLLSTDSYLSSFL